MNARATVKLCELLGARYVDDFAHLGIGSDSDEIPEWEDYLEGLGIGIRTELTTIPKGFVPTSDPLFTNLFRLVPEQLAEKVLVLGQFPGRVEE